MCADCLLSSQNFTIAESDAVTPRSLYYNYYVHLYSLPVLLPLFCICFLTLAGTFGRIWRCVKRMVMWKYHNVAEERRHQHRMDAERAWRSQGETNGHLHSGGSPLEESTVPECQRAFQNAPVLTPSPAASPPPPKQRRKMAAPLKKEYVRLFSGDF